MTKPNTPVITSWSWDSGTKLATVNIEGDQDSEIKVFWEDNFFQSAAGFLGSRTGSGQIVAELDYHLSIFNITLNAPVSLFPQAVNQSGEYSDPGLPVFPTFQSLTSSLYAQDVHREDDELHFFIADIEDYHQVLAFAVFQGNLNLTFHRGAGEQVVSGLDQKVGYVFICVVLDELHRRIDGIFIMNVPALSIVNRNSPVICPRRNNYI